MREMNVGEAAEFVELDSPTSCSQELSPEAETPASF
jgi:hypothetical protein